MLLFRAGRVLLKWAWGRSWVLVVVVGKMSVEEGGR
jgi:hypothetical protein